MDKVVPDHKELKIVHEALCRKVADDHRQNPNLLTFDWTGGVSLIKIELIKVCTLLSPNTNWIRQLTEATFLSGTVKVR